MFATIRQGSLLVLDGSGNMVANLSDSHFLNGPWDLAVQDDGVFAQFFVSNVLDGTVTRLNVLALPSVFMVLSKTRIASGYLHRSDPATLAVGPTGLAYDAEKDFLYVASTGDNAIYGIPRAGRRYNQVARGELVYADDAHLRGPLGLALTPDDTLIATNGDAVNPAQPSEMVEFSRNGQFIDEVPVDSGRIQPRH